jgi:hypothetical protein
METNNPSLYFINTLKFNRDSVVLKENLPKLVKSMVNGLNTLVLVRESFDSNGSALGTLYYTGSTLGFTYEPIVNIGKVEDLSSISSDIFNEVRNISNLLNQNGSITNDTGSLKDKLQENNINGSGVINALDNINSDLDTFNQSIQNFNNKLGRYTSEFEQVTNIVKKISIYISSSQNQPLSPGSFPISLFRNDDKFSSTANTTNITTTGSITGFEGEILTTPAINTQIVTTNTAGQTFTETTTTTTFLTQSNPCPPSNELTAFKIFVSSSMKEKIDEDNTFPCSDQIKEYWRKYQNNYKNDKNAKFEEDRKKSLGECPSDIGSFYEWLQTKDQTLYNTINNKKNTTSKKSEIEEKKCGKETKSAWNKYKISYDKEKNSSFYPLLNSQQSNTLPTSSIPSPPTVATSSIIRPFDAKNYFDDVIIFLGKISEQETTQTTVIANQSGQYVVNANGVNQIYGTTIASKPVDDTTIVYSRNRDTLTQTLNIQNNPDYSSTQDITDLANFISNNNIKRIYIINLWSFSKPLLPSIDIRGKVINSLNQPIKNSKVKFKPVLNAANRAKIEQLLATAGITSLYTQGQQNIQTLISAYQDVLNLPKTGSINTSSIDGDIINRNIENYG